MPALRSFKRQSGDKISTGDRRIREQAFARVGEVEDRLDKQIAEVRASLHKELEAFVREETKARATLLSSIGAIFAQQECAIDRRITQVESNLVMEEWERRQGDQKTLTAWFRRTAERIRLFLTQPIGLPELVPSTPLAIVPEGTPTFVQPSAHETEAGDRSTGLSAPQEHAHPLTSEEARSQTAPPVSSRLERLATYARIECGNMTGEARANYLESYFKVAAGSEAELIGQKDRFLELVEAGPVEEEAVARVPLHHGTAHTTPVYEITYRVQETGRSDIGGSIRVLAPDALAAAQALDRAFPAWYTQLDVSDYTLVIEGVKGVLHEIKYEVEGP